MTTKNTKNEAARVAAAKLAADLAAIKSLVTPIDRLISYSREAGEADAKAKNSPLTIGKMIYANTRWNALKAGDCRAMYLAYAEGQNNASEKGDKVDLTNKDVVKNGVSQFTRFHRLANLGTKPYFEVIDTARAAISAHLAKTTKVKPGAAHYTRVLRVIAAQIKRGADSALMTPDEIISTVFPAKEEKSVEEQLKEIGKAAQRGIDANPTESWYFAQVLDTVNEMIKKTKAGTPAQLAAETEDEQEDADEALADMLAADEDETENENENELENMIAA
jgi:hypothetical protein